MIIIAKHSIIKQFYNSKEWIALRLVLINERMTKDGVRCEHCSKLIARAIDIIGHHKIELTPENIYDVTISLNPNLIELICFDCHNKEHYRFGYKPGKNVYIVYGSPLSGKSTFVKQNMIRGDLVVDMDRLYEAVSLLPCYDKPDNILSNVMAMHNVLIDNIKTRYGKWYNSWVIGGYADKYKRERLANDLGAELIYIESTKEECFAKLDCDELRQYRKDEWKGYIVKWFDQYRE